MAESQGFSNEETQSEVGRALSEGAAPSRELLTGSFYGGLGAMGFRQIRVKRRGRG